MAQQRKIEKLEKEYKKYQSALEEANKKAADAQRRLDAIEQELNGASGSHKLTSLGLAEFEFKSIGKKMSDLVLLSDAERGKLRKSITEEEMEAYLMGKNQWDRRNISAYLSGTGQHCLGWE